MSQEEKWKGFSYLWERGADYVDVFNIYREKIKNLLFIGIKSGKGEISIKNGP